MAAPVTVPSTNAPTSSGGSGSSTNIGAIVGGVVGGICGLALIVGGVFYWRRRKAAKESNVDKVSNPVYDATATGGFLGLGQQTLQRIPYWANCIS